MAYSRSAPGKWTFYYTNLGLNLQSFQEFRERVKSVLGFSVNVLVSNKWQYKCMVTSKNQRDIEESYLSDKSDWNNLVLFNYSYSDLYKYRHKIKYVSANFLDETNLKFADTSITSTTFMDKLLCYENGLPKRIVPYITVITAPPSASMFPAIINDPDSKVAYLTTIHYGEQFELAAIKNVLQQAATGKLIVYPSSSECFYNIMDKILREEIRVSHVFKYNSFIYLPFKKRPIDQMGTPKYISWEIYRSMRLKELDSHWAPYFHSASNLLNADEDTTVFIGSNHPDISYNCLKSRLAFYLL